MQAFILKCRATGAYCAGVDTGRRAVMVTEELDQAEAWADRNQAVAAARALARAGGVFCWQVEQRAGEVAARLIQRAQHGARRLESARQAAELTEGQYAAVRETSRILGAAVEYLDRACGTMREAGIRFDDRAFSSLYDRLWNVAAPFDRMLIDHLEARAAAGASA